MVGQTVFVCLTYSLLQIHLLQKGYEESNRRTWPTSRWELPDGDRVIIYRQQTFAFFTLLEHMQMTLSLNEKARRWNTVTAVDGLERQATGARRSDGHGRRRYHEEIGGQRQNGDGRVQCRSYHLME
ncbi:MAG: hypothetical protein EHM42_02300 [Planctomycetaceae bacterium]|nr:MAG: hypothetical protein EHM42_02300 [Planctomycetaceae bacterium]